MRITKQFGLGFLPLMVMEDQKLVEKQSKAAGLPEVKGVFMTLSNPAAMNDGLLSGQIDFGTNGPPAMITIWARTKGSGNEIKGVAGMVLTPMWLNVNNPAIKSIRDFTDKDKIAVTAVKVSIPAIIMQMAAMKEWGKDSYAKLDPLTVSMSHPDGMAAFLSKRDISAHFTSPPFMYRELEQPGIHRIMSSDDVMGGPTTFSNLYSTSKFHDANPRTYKAVLAAFTEAIDTHQQGQEARGGNLPARVGRQEEHGGGDPEATRGPQSRIHGYTAQYPEVRGFHVRGRLDQDQGGFVEGCLFPRDS